MVAAKFLRNRVEIKSVTKKKQNDKTLAFWHQSKISVTWLFATF